MHQHRRCVGRTRSKRLIAFQSMPTSVFFLFQRRTFENANLKTASYWTRDKIEHAIPKHPTVPKGHEPSGRKLMRLYHVDDSTLPRRLDQPNQFLLKWGARFVECSVNHRPTAQVSSVHQRDLLAAPIDTPVEPEDNAVVHSENVTFVVDVHDDDGGDDLRSIVLLLDDYRTISQYKFTPDLGNGRYSFTIGPLENGEYRWSVTVKDSTRISSSKGVQYFSVSYQEGAVSGTSLVSDRPSSMPSVYPSDVQSSFPSSEAPSIFISSDTPSYMPSSTSDNPSFMPSSFPSSLSSSDVPSLMPSSLPSWVPSGFPSLMPSGVPSYSTPAPTTPAPSSAPTRSPTRGPTGSPTPRPTRFPTPEPTFYPTPAPNTRAPSLSPTTRAPLIPTAPSPKSGPDDVTYTYVFPKPGSTLPDPVTFEWEVKATSSAAKISLVMLYVKYPGGDEAYLTRFPTTSGHDSLELPLDEEGSFSWSLWVQVNGKTFREGPWSSFTVLPGPVDPACPENLG